MCKLTMDTKISHDSEERFCSAACQGYHHVIRIPHDCRRCSAACKGYTEKEVEVISSASPPPIIKAATAPTTTVTKVEFNFFNDWSVTDLAQKINLDLSGALRIKKSQKEPKITDTNNQKEAMTKN